MAKSSITPQVLEMLLENWGLFVTTGNWGPKQQRECGSAERAYSQVRGGYDSKATVQCDETLGVRLEHIICDLPIEYVNILVRRYGYRRVIFGAYSLAILDCAKVAVHEKLEEQGYA